MCTKPSTAVRQPILLIGHTGSLGRALSRVFRERGHRVCGIASSDADLRRPESVRYLAERVERTTILVMAAAIRPEVAEGLEVAEANLAMAMHLARLLEERPICQCVYLSSVSVYGECAHTAAMTEDTPVAPASYYGIAKAAGEALLRCAAEAVGTELLVVRPCRLYGPGDASVGYGPARFLDEAMGSHPIALYGDGEELRDHVYVEDAARVIADLVAAGQRGVFNLATGVSLPYTRWVEIIRACLGQAVEVVHRPRTRPRYDQQFDISRLRQALPGLRFTEPHEAMGHCCHAREVRVLGAVSTDE